MKKILEIAIALILLISIYSVVKADTEELLIGTFEVNEEILQEIEILSDSGVKMRSAPSESSSEILIIPKGTDLLGHPIKGSETSVLWAYVKYEDKEGWIDCRNNEVGHTYPVDSNILFIYDTPIYSDVNLTKEIGSIPSYTIINSKKMLSLDFSNAFADDNWKEAFNYDEKKINKVNYIEYDNIYGYIKLEKYGIESSGKYTVKLEDTALYENPSDDSNILIENIPIETVIDYTYYAEVGHEEGTTWKKGLWVYTEYKGEKGWVPTVDEEYLTVRNQIIDIFNAKAQEANKAYVPDTSKNIIIISVASVILVVLIVLLVIVKKENK